jgi:hypothetical protein
VAASLAPDGMALSLHSAMLSVGIVFAAMSIFAARGIRRS